MNTVWTRKKMKLVHHIKKITYSNGCAMAGCAIGVIRTTWGRGGQEENKNIKEEAKALKKEEKEAGKEKRGEN